MEVFDECPNSWSGSMTWCIQSYLRTCSHGGSWTTKSNCTRCQGPYSSPLLDGPPELAKLRRQLCELLDAGCIQPSKAPCGAFVLFHKKQYGFLQTCIDCRALNKVTVKNKYPVPLRSQCHKKHRLLTCWISCLRQQTSPSWICNQVIVKLIAEGDKRKTACVIMYCSYKFLVMPFGLTNATKTFSISWMTYSMISWTSSLWFAWMLRTT